MRIFTTGGTGVLGRALRPLASLAGHELEAPGHDELDLFDAGAVRGAVAGNDALLHLATRIPSLTARAQPDSWRENDRLRTDAARILVDAAIATGVAAYVQPTIALLYPANEGADEDTPIGDIPPPMRSALVAERETARFCAHGGRGVVLRMGLLDGPGTGNSEPNNVHGSTLHVADAAEALLRALATPSGIYNVCRDGERVSNERFRRATGWHPRHERAALAIDSARASRMPRS